ncbi:MAG TPA: ADP-ribosylglycohydrolase family protein [Candidatus Acidoferrales bacterium]|nr:ADP-ribosylglycohydrolase family protein [Candidatus Acidoferrales bacterium]
MGQCLGDALGFVMEGRPPFLCRKYVEDVLKTRRIDAVEWGQYSDDSQLARELIISYVRKSAFDQKDFANRIMLLFQEGRVVGGGLATRRAAERLARGVPSEEAGEPSPYAGNGAAMRAGPIGLIFYDRPEKLVQASQDQSQITHKDRRCWAGAVAVAAAVAEALDTNPIQVKAFCGRLADWVHIFDPILATALQNQMSDWLKLEPRHAREEISGVGVSRDFAGPRWEGIPPFVTPSVLWSLYSFLRTPKDYWESICTAITGGGDVDTTAAMTGAISGARVGIEGLPNDWARRVTDRGKCGYEDLIKLATECYETRSKD